jgi:hypothetical protein
MQIKKLPYTYENFSKPGGSVDAWKREWVDGSMNWRGMSG